MDYAYRVLKNMKYFYNTINPATLSGAIDVIVVEQPDGEFKSTPFHVRFGKYGVFSHSDKYVDIQINGEEIDLKMKLGESGVAFFVEEADGSQVPSYMLTSPLPEPGATPTQTTDQVLTESAKILGGNVAGPATDSALATARDASPEPLRKKDLQEPKQEQSLLEVQQRNRNLPFNSSVFSIRKNRSLPDLQSISNHQSGYHSDIEGTPVKTPSRKLSRPLRHSKSQAFDKTVKRDRSVDSVGSVAVATKAPSQRRKKSRVAFQPPESSDSEDSSVSLSPARTTHLDARDVDRIADGALSDSEVDRHRNTPEPHASDVTDWKWGELPETRENRLKQEQGKSKDTLKPKGETSGWTWFPWGHRSSTAAAPPAEEGISLDELFSPAGTSDPSKMEKYLGKANSTAVSIDSGNASRGTSQPSSPTGQSDDANFADKTPTQEATPVVEQPDHQPRTRNASDQRSAFSNDDIFPLSEDELDELRPSTDSRPSYMLSLRISSDKLKSLGLLYGANECRFSITTKFQGTSWCSCNIYLYKWYERIVISDIDGTITKSDVLGHVIPAIGGTWAHAGVAELYTRIKNNGYKMVYLSSRAIGQSHTTKQYLKSIAQDSKQLPDGPVLLSPTSVLIAFRREVIERRPEEFKIAALTDLKNLFPVKQPFFAGFGNRETDVTSYRAVGIMPARILIIDPSGRVRRSDSVGYVSSYSSMATETVDYLFPPLMRSATSDSDVRMLPLQPTWTNPLECSTFTHWKPEKMESITDTDIAAYEAYRKKSAEEKAKKK